MPTAIAAGRTATSREDAGPPVLTDDVMLRGDRRAMPRGGDRRRFPRRRVDLMGLPVDQLTEQGTVETVLAAIRSGRGGCLFTPNLHHVQAYASGAVGHVYRDSRRLDV